MDKKLIKIIALIAALIVLVGAVVYILISGVSLGPIKAISVAGIGQQSDAVQQAKDSLSKAQSQYDNNLSSLELAKKEYNNQKEKYELISDETINAVKEATMEEEYMIEYLWITLGNYATAHNLELAIIEPGGSVEGNTPDDAGVESDETAASTGTGVAGNSSGVTSTTNSETTGSSTSGTTQDGQTSTPEQTTSVTTGLSSSADALTVQVKGSYIDLADFVFEVENDTSLRFRLDNIKMKSAGGAQVITSFNVKDFTVLKSLE